MQKLLSVFILLALSLFACVPAPPTETEPPAEEIPTQTETPVQPKPQAQVSGDEEPTPTKTPTPTATPFVCTKLISPENGLELPAVGKVTFAWEPVDGADSYLLQFTLPNGTIVTFETDQTTVDRYMEAFGMSGEFEWNVAALNVNENEICTSILFKFTKPAYTKGSKDGGSGGENQCVPDGLGGCVGPGGNE